MLSDGSGGHGCGRGGGVAVGGDAVGRGSGGDSRW